MKTISNVKDFAALKGTEIGASDWLTISQERINDFAKATGDYQWIHVNEERCKSESPFRKPIAHGFLTLSMIPVLYEQIVQVENIRMAVNYGLNKVRFLAPVPVNSKIRLVLELADYEEVKGGVKIINKCTIEIEGRQKPACIAETIIQYFAA